RPQRRVIMSAPTLEPPITATGHADTAPASEDSPMRARASRGVCLVAALILTAIGVYDVKAHVPANVFAIPGSGETVSIANSLAPQGWAFFTRSPREEALRVYPVRDGALGEHVQPANAEPSNAFGFDRGSRSQGTEIGLLNAAVPASAWVACEGDRAGCLGEALTVAGAGDLPTIPNEALVATVCGPTVFSSEVPGAWAYRDLVDDPWRSAQYAVAEVTC